MVVNLDEDVLVDKDFILDLLEFLCVLDVLAHDHVLPIILHDLRHCLRCVLFPLLFEEVLYWLLILLYPD